MLIRNNPWKLLNDLSNIVDIRFRPQVDNDHVESSWIPAVDIKEETDKFIVKIDIPGVNPQNVEITMENNVLILKGSREEINPEEKTSYHRLERIKGSFYRCFTLPDTANPEQVTAKSRHGVLEVIIDKKKTVQARKITIETQE